MTVQQTINYVPNESDEPNKPAESAKKPDAPAAEPGTGLIVLNPTDIVKHFSEEKGLDPVIEQIRKRVKSELFDVTTEEGRARIGSVARQIGSSKMRLKEMGQALTEDWRKKTKAVTAETTRMETELDALRDEVLAPRVEFENRERVRVEGHRHRLDQIAALALFQDPDYPPTSAVLESRIAHLNNDFKDIQWDEFANSAKAAIEKAGKDLADMLARAKKAEADAAELERLRQEEAARKQKERDEQIAAEAAAKAKKEAEDAAAIELVWVEAHAEKAFREAKAEADRLEREKEAANARALMMEQERVTSHKNAILTMAEMLKVPPTAPTGVLMSRIDTLKTIYKRDWQEFAPEAAEIYDTGIKNLTVLHINAAKKEADEKAAADKAIADKAVQDENNRIAEEKRKQKEADDQRAADKAHRAKIDTEAMNALAAVVPAETDGLAHEIAEAVLIAIAEGKIPHITIKY